MPLARILTQNPDDASAVHDYLERRGYQVEFADPSALNLPPADLEINLERLLLEDGLRLAAEWAESSGADVYVAAGAIAPAQHADAIPMAPPQGAVERPAEISSFVPLTFGRQETEGQEPIAPRAEAPVPIEPSMLERWNRALAERRAARQERKAHEKETARLAMEQRARREAQAAALARELREQAAQREAARPAIVAGAAVRAIQPKLAPRPVLQPVLERRVNPARRDDHEIAAEYWKGAFTGAAAVAIILMVAWATLGSSHPTTPASNSGQVKQEVPFGPVTLAPGSAAPLPAERTASATPATVHAVTPAPKPVPVRTHTTKRAASKSRVADDDVVVRHFGPKPAVTNTASTAAKNGGLKRISDQ